MDDSQDKSYVQSLIDEWKKIQIDKFRVAEAEKKLLSKIEKASGGFVGKTLVVLKGITEVLKIRPRLNVRYDKDRGEEHPLKTLCDKFPQLKDLIRVTYAESGKKVERLLEEYDSDEKRNLSQDDRMLAQEILKVRSVSDGKPAIEALSYNDEQR